MVVTEWYFPQAFCNQIELPLLKYCHCPLCFQIRCLCGVYTTTQIVRVDDKCLYLDHLQILLYVIATSTLNSLTLAF